MITLKTLNWNNCFSYGSNNSLELDQSNLTQIIGINGTGKSSIPLIIEEVLYNKNSKGIKKIHIPNRHINKGYDIYLSWEKDEDLYEIKVDRKAALKVSLVKNGKDISSHTATNTYKTVQDILGIDFKTFSQLVYQSTNASLQFLTATDTNRKKFLIDLLHLEEYVELFDNFKQVAKTVQSDIDNLNGKIATIEKWLVDNNLEDTTILPSINLEIDMESDEKEAHELMIELANISEKNKKITTNNKYKDLLNQINLQELNSIKAKEKLSYDSLNKKIGNKNAIITASQAQLDKLKKLTDTCPTCLQPVDTEFILNLLNIEVERIAKAEKDKNELARSIEEIKRNNELFERKTKLQKDWEDLYRSIDLSLPKNTLDREKLELRLQRVQKRLRDAKANIAEVTAENERRAKHNTRIQVILEQTETFETELNHYLEKLKETEKLLNNLEVLKKAFSTNGLLAYKIENLVKELEELTNTYLAELSDGKFTIEFIINNDKLNVHVTDNGNLVDIINLSSGELARVNTATLLAIRKLMSSISDSKINILFLDEVINVLDETGREKLVEILVNEIDLNTYIVSHQWEHPLLNKLNIVKENDISKIE